jgi:hypothetical protein
MPHHGCADRKPYRRCCRRGGLHHGRVDHGPIPNRRAAGEAGRSPVRRLPSLAGLAGTGETMSRLRLGSRGAALSRRRLLSAAGLERSSHRPPLGAVGRRFRQHPVGPSGNRALCQILDRDGDRALSYRLLGATAFEAAFVVREETEVRPRDSGGGEPCEAWWRACLTQSFVVVTEISSRPAPLPPSCARFGPNVRGKVMLAHDTW